MTNLSNDARRLLVTASDADGNVMTVQALTHFTVQAGGQVFVNAPDGRERTHWKSVISDLHMAGLITPEGYQGQSWSVTPLGYEIADQIKAAEGEP